MPLPRLHWSVDGAAYKWSKELTAVAGTFTSNERAILDGSSTSIDAVAVDDGFIVRLGGSTNVDRIGVRISCGGGPVSAIVQYSTDSTNGIDGTWGTLTSVSVPTEAPIQYAEYTFAPVTCAWLRCSPVQGWSSTLFSFFIFGEVVSPAYAFYDAAGNAQLNTAAYPLAFSAAGNAADAHQQIAFNIKNTSLTTPHVYELTVNGYVSTDTAITDYFKLSLDAGSTKLRTVTTPSVAAESMCAVTLYMDLPAANNPADGYHYFAIDVVVVS